MKNLAIARRYAKALLLIGKEDGQIETYKEELNGVVNLLEQQKELEQAITNPLYETSGRKKVLGATADRLNLSNVSRTFLFLLFDKGRIGLLSNINDFYQKMSDELQGIARAELISAVTLSVDATDKIRESLAKMTGKEVKLTVEQDPSLIGGIVTKIGDLVLDGSIKTQLLNMRESLKRGESV